jgi:hypothetical protein
MEIVRIKTSPPTIEGLAADAEVAASQSRILPARAIEIHPGQTN